MVLTRVTCGQTSWAMSLSPVEITTSRPSAAVCRARVQHLVQAAGFQGYAQVVAAEEGAQQVLLEVTRQRGHRADAQRLAGLSRALQGGLQFAAEGEDG